MEISYFGALILSCLLVVSLGYPQGAPVRQESCVNLQPIHIDPQTQQQVQNQNNDNPPYVVTLNRNKYSSCTSRTPQLCRQPVIVQIQGQGANFRGFIIQARTPSGGSRSWGQFFPTQNDAKIIRCQNGLTLTHTANNDKQSVTFQWIPEPNMREQVQFVATVVQNLRTIYPRVYSRPLPAMGEEEENSTTGPGSSAPTVCKAGVSVFLGFLGLILL